MTELQQAKFAIGQIVKHKLFGYRGVIADVDPSFQASEDWYLAMAKSQPPKERPWYHILVHNAIHTTYVAERNLMVDRSNEPIRHPAVGEVFGDFSDGRYILKCINN